MRRIYLAIMAAACSLILAASGMAQPANQNQPPAQRQAEDQYAQQIMDPDGVRKLKVHDARGEEIGSIDGIVLDAREGRIAYIIVRSGGAFGMGGEKSIVPWGAVQFQQSARQEDPILMVNVNSDRLLAAPHGDAQDMDGKYAQLIHDYYGIAPYWQSPGQEEEQQNLQQPAAPQPR